MGVSPARTAGGFDAGWFLARLKLWHVVVWGLFKLYALGGGDYATCVGEKSPVGMGGLWDFGVEGG
jgi:hypothetical protein